MSPGKIAIFTQDQHQVIARLFNFEIGKHQLKAQHTEWLGRSVVGLLKHGGSLWITGLASPFDTESRNRLLSRRRADEVIGYLRKQSPNNFRIAFDWAAGESMARISGVPNGAEDENWRGVIVSAWFRPTPPPPPPRLPVSTAEPKQIQRIVHRYFSKINSSYSNNPGGKGSFDQGIEALGELLGGWASSELGSMIKGDEWVRARKYKNVDATHRVNQVEISKVHTYEVGWNHEIDTISCDVNYVWGIPLPYLTVFYKSTFIGLRKDEVDRHPVPKVIPIIRDKAEKSSLLFPQ